MLLRLPSRSPLLVALCALGVSSAAHALERVNLKTGFSYDCVRHEAADENHVRLYLYDADSQSTDRIESDRANSDRNYILIPVDRIASVEPLPDPPRPQPVLVAPQPSAATDVTTLLAHAGAQHNIDVNLLASIVKAESGGNSHAVSRTGARGLMQLMPGTARELGVQDAFKPDQNIDGGAKYLDALLTQYSNNLSLALAAYNAGPAAVDRYHGVPPYRETRAYVARVENEFIRRTQATEHAAKQAARQSASHPSAIAATILP